MDVAKAIKSRRSIRKFTDKKPNWRKIIECIDYIRYTPMAGNLFTLKFILIQDKNKILKISEASEQNFISQTHYVLVVCTNPSKTKNQFNERAEKYCRQQAGAGIQNLLLMLENKGMNSCWIGHFNENMIKENLDIPSDVNVEAILPIGFKQRTLKDRTRKTKLDSILYFEKYGNKKMNKIKKINT